MAKNVLYYGDNLDILRRHIKDESVDLVYLDPPFKSNQDYNVLFEERNGSKSKAQIKAFEDTWRWDQGSAERIVDTQVLAVIVQVAQIPASGGHAAVVLIPLRRAGGGTPRFPSGRLSARRRREYCRPCPWRSPPHRGR